MIDRTIVRAILVLSIALPRLHAQDGVILSAGYQLAGEPDDNTWRLTVQRALLGPIGVDLSGNVLPGEGGTSGRLFGVGLDFTLFDGGDRMPAVFIGGTAGVGFRDQDRVWYGSSIGVRQPLFSIGAIRGTLEGRWRNSTIEGRDGVELSFGLGWRKPRRGAAGVGEVGLYVPKRTTERLRAAGIPDSKAELLGAVVSTALEEMGQPYVWGGTGDGSGGFDCSGLIYYAYGQHGIRIPRTSASQAGAGIPIRRDIDELLPGDILTFAVDGDKISHVGLYVGEGRFIHSAAKGVSISRLAEDDPTGRYWLRRWVGVRRVVE
ncbi:MAG: C40 family peptidase [Gemmatimonadota bacterium]